MGTFTDTDQRKVSFYTLGCKLNFSETSTIARQFEKQGFQRVDFGERADVYVINTCSVTENADKKCKQVVKQVKKIAPESYVAIIGCYAQLKPQEIVGIPGVDAVLGAAEKFRLLELLDGFVKTEKPKMLASDVSYANQFVSSYSMNDRTRTFLKVQDGCNYNCSFCTIPLARGKSRSDTLDNVIANAHEIAQTDVKEVVLTGVNLGDYGIIGGRRQWRFIDLIRKLDEVEGIDRFRISSIEPNLLTDEIIDFVSKSKRFVPHFHIPLQSGSDALLEKMRRRYRRDLYRERVSTIKRKMPHCCIGVDVIVGFPGESGAHFEDTYQFLQEMNVSYLHVFTYSERANTPAPDMEGRVDVSVRRKRSKMLRILSEKKRHAFYESQVGRKGTALFENDIEGGKIHGFTENYVRVAVPFQEGLINTFQEVEMIEIGDRVMEGKFLNGVWNKGSMAVAFQNS